MQAPGVCLKRDFGTRLGLGWTWLGLGWDYKETKYALVDLSKTSLLELIALASTHEEERQIEKYSQYRIGGSFFFENLGFRLEY